MKKIMFYTMIMTKGGTEQSICNLANYFSKYYEIVIVSNINEKCEYKLNSNIRYITLDKNNKRYENTLKKCITKLSSKRSRLLKNIIDIEQPDLIITFLPEPTIRCLSLKKYYSNIPIFVAIRNHPTKEFNLLFLKLIRNNYYKIADKIIIQDESYSNYLPTYLDKKIVTIPNFISSEFINNKASTKRDKKIVTVSRLDKQKNIPLLIKSFSHLDKRFSSYKLYIYGEGPERYHLQKLINKLNMNDKIVLTGKVKKIFPCIKNAEIFILCSNYEGMPNSLLEAMALGLPVITTMSTEAIDSIVLDHKNGLVIEKNNEFELINSIEYLLDNKEVTNKMGIEASLIKNKYKKEVIIHLWDDVIKSYLQ